MTTRRGERVQKLREHLDWTQEELAQLVGVSTSMIARLEQGKTKKPRPRDLRAIATALGVSAAELGVSAGVGSSEAPRLEAGEDFDARLSRAFRGNLRQIADFMIQTDGLDERDRRIVIEAVQWAQALIDRGQQYQDARHSAIGAVEDAGQIVTSPRSANVRH